MQKYQEMFLKRIYSTIQAWKQRETVTNSEIYQLLHSIKGTAKSIGIDELTEIAESLIKHVKEEGDKEWNKKEWETFFEPVQLYINSHKISDEITKEEVELLPQPIQDEDQPLVLLVEDDIEMLTHFKERLEKEHYTVLVATSVTKAVRMFYDQSPDYVILDIFLKNEDGFDLLIQIIERAKKMLIPIMILSADDRTETKIKAYELGALDYVSKPFNIDEVMALIRNRLSIQSLITPRLLNDELTGAYNRKFLFDELERQMLDFERRQIPFSICLLDLDHFKKVNDTYGHDVGDEVLRSFAKIVTNKIRKNDYFIRYGGEEFILLMQNTDSQAAEEGIKRLLEEFASYEFKVEEDVFSCTFSAGIVETATNVNDAETLIKLADDALYFAKRNGRNQVKVYDGNESCNAKKENNVIHIGIIDDDTVIHQLLMDQLPKLTFNGYETDVKAFREGESFFNSDWYKQDGKYIILLDGIMPRMDGLEVLKRLRDECPVEDFVILMLTGRKKDQDIVKALELGADDYMTKPFSLNELVARLNRLASRLLLR